MRKKAKFGRQSIIVFNKMVVNSGWLGHIYHRTWYNTIYYYICVAKNSFQTIDIPTHKYFIIKKKIYY